MAILGMTQKIHAVVLLLKCPYSYARAEGGGAILQRLGTPYTCQHLERHCCQRPPLTLALTLT